MITPTADEAEVNEERGYLKRRVDQCGCVA